MNTTPQPIPVPSSHADLRHRVKYPNTIFTLSSCTVQRVISNTTPASRARPLEMWAGTFHNRSFVSYLLDFVPRAHFVVNNLCHSFHRDLATRPPGSSFAVIEFEGNNVGAPILRYRS